eukprot:2062501-Pyramimonas_sp.AAC.1
MGADRYTRRVTPEGLIESSEIPAKASECETKGRSRSSLPCGARSCSEPYYTPTMAAGAARCSAGGRGTASLSHSL